MTSVLALVTSIKGSSEYASRRLDLIRETVSRHDELKTLHHDSEYQLALQEYDAMLDSIAKIAMSHDPVRYRDAVSKTREHEVRLATYIGNFITKAGLKDVEC